MCTGPTPTGLACCSRGAPCAAGHRARESVLQAEWLSGPEGVARTSTRARETPAFVGTWLWVGGRSLQDYPARGCHPRHPFQTSAWRRRSLHGWPGGRLTPHLPVQLAPNWGRGRRPGIASLLTPRLPPASVSLLEAYRALQCCQAPPSAPDSRGVQTLPWPPLAPLAPLAPGLRAGPRRAPGAVAAAAARGQPSGPTSPPAARVPLPRSGPRASSLLI